MQRCWNVGNRQKTALVNGRTLPPFQRQASCSTGGQRYYTATWLGDTVSFDLLPGLTISSIPWSTTFVGKPSLMRQALTDFFASKIPEFTVRALLNWRNDYKSFWMPIGFTLRTNDMIHLLYNYFSNKSKTTRTFWLHCNKNYSIRFRVKLQ